VEYKDNEETTPSKTWRKKDMRALREVGEQLVELDPKN
jgi:ribosome-associated protein